MYFRNNFLHKILHRLLKNYLNILHVAVPSGGAIKGFMKNYKEFLFLNCVVGVGGVAIDVKSDIGILKEKTNLYASVDFFNPILELSVSGENIGIDYA